MPRLALQEDTLIAHLHRAALDRAGWQDFALALESLLDGVRASLHVVSMRDGAQAASAMGGYDPGFVDSYCRYYHAINPYLRISSTMPCGRARLSVPDLADDRLSKSEFYQDWLRPQGDLSVAVAIKARPFQGRTVSLPLHIMRRTSDDIAPRAMDLLNRLEPHLSHAFQVSETVSALRMGSLGTGVLVIGRDKRLIWTDQGCVAQEGRVFGLDMRGRIRFRDPDAQDWLSTRLSGPGMGDEIGRITTREGWRILALRPEGDVVPSLVLGTIPPLHARIVLVLSAPPDASHREILRLRFRLTGAETAIALAIAAGKSTAEMADAAGVSIHTIRNQVRAVLHKTDARNRADVVRIVAGLAQPH